MRDLRQDLAQARRPARTGKALLGNHRLSAQYLNAYRSVHIAIDEKISAMIKRDGGVAGVEIKGDMMLRVSDPNKARIKVAITGALQDETVQFKTHPNVDKNLFGSDNVLALKDSGKPFPLNQSLGILRWRYSSKDSGNVPLSSWCSRSHSIPVPA